MNKNSYSNINLKIFILITLFIGLPIHNLLAQAPIVYSDAKQRLIIGKDISVLKDPLSNLSVNEVLRSENFIKSTKQVPNLGISDATFWIKFSIINETNSNHLFLYLGNPLLNDAKLYSIDNNGIMSSQESGDAMRFSFRKYPFPNPLFDINAPQNIKREFLLRIKSTDLISLPIFLASDTQTFKSISKDESISGIYMGIILALLFYNLFIYFSVRDNTYVLYVLYLLFIGLTQISLLGYPLKYFWPNHPGFEHLSIILFPALAGSFAMLFAKYFIHTKQYTPKIDRLFLFIMGAYFIAVILRIFDYNNLSYRLIDISGMAASITVLISAIIIARKPFRTGKFFLLAWMIFIVGILLFSLKNLGVLPYNYFTRFTMYIGTCIEAILLSFALADKINVYRKEKEISQAKALQVSMEKEQYVREQNVVLEAKVRERTNRLTQSNKELTRAMDNLQKAESQLVHAEKMASLGQLTAGIAHEINNPINFVKSNIKPLRLDLQDMREMIQKYKQVNKENIDEKLKEIEAFHEEIDWESLDVEINELLNGIEEGSARTAEIVRGLRTFSRLDEDELKEADIHAGLDSTLTLLKHILPPELSVIREYGEVPLIECYPGRLNQAFMNILTNSIQAITSKDKLENEKIAITTRIENDNVVINIADTGTGIPDAIKTKIFDPFFTTKNVGEGTGLGLSMTFSIIQEHHGNIAVNSEDGKGSEFIITIPVKQYRKD